MEKEYDMKNRRYRHENENKKEIIHSKFKTRLDVIFMYSQDKESDFYDL